MCDILFNVGVGILLGGMIGGSLIIVVCSVYLERRPTLCRRSMETVLCSLRLARRYSLLAAGGGCIVALSEHLCVRLLPP